MPHALAHSLNSSALSAQERKALLKRRARAMRHAPTPSEARLWALLSGGKLGLPFRRQAVIAEHIVDFVCYSRRLVVEVDGGAHQGRDRRDAQRLRRLRAAGYHVLVVSHDEVMAHLRGVAKRVVAAGYGRRDGGA